MQMKGGKKERGLLICGCILSVEPSGNAVQESVRHHGLTSFFNL